MTITTTFVECVSCGREQTLTVGPDTTDAAAAAVARRKGWTVIGFAGAKRTRCPSCRKGGRRDTKAADEGRIGNRAGWQTRGRVIA